MSWFQPTPGFFLPGDFLRWFLFFFPPTLPAVPTKVSLLILVPSKTESDRREWSLTGPFTIFFVLRISPPPLSFHPENQ